MGAIKCTRMRVRGLLTLAEECGLSGCSKFGGGLRSGLFPHESGMPHSCARGLAHSWALNVLCPLCLIAAINVPWLLAETNSLQKQRNAMRGETEDVRLPSGTRVSRFG